MLTKEQIESGPQYFWTADLHLGHDNIRRLCHRPFNSCGEMDEIIIQNINEVVKPNDRLFVLGDFTFRASRNVAYYTDQIACQNKFLIWGNHDPFIDVQKAGLKIRCPHPDLYKCFTHVDKWLTIEVNIDGIRQPIHMNHFACRTWDKSFHGSWNLYGHSHGKLYDDPNALSLDVGVDAHNFKPWSLDEVLEHMNGKTDPIDAQQSRETGEMA